MVKARKLELACGQTCQEGFIGVDIVKCKGVKVVHDLLKFPWPFKSNSVEEIFCQHFLEHVPNKLRFKFMDEVHRILETGGKAKFITPYWANVRSVQDPTHEWPPICEQSYLYFNKKWRDENKLDHYPVKCDFDFSIYYNVDNELANRSEETKLFWVKHYVNAASDLQVVLTKR